MTGPVTGVSNSDTEAGVTGANTADGDGVAGIASSQGGQGVHGESNSGFAGVAGYNKLSSHRARGVLAWTRRAATFTAVVLMSAIASCGVASADWSIPPLDPE